MTSRPMTLSRLADRRALSKHTAPPIEGLFLETPFPKPALSNVSGKPRAHLATQLHFGEGDESVGPEDDAFAGGKLSSVLKRLVEHTAIAMAGGVICSNWSVYPSMVFCVHSGLRDRFAVSPLHGTDQLSGGPAFYSAFL